MTSARWGGAGKGGEPKERGQYIAGTDSRRGRSILPPAPSGGGEAGLRPAGAAAGQRVEAVLFDVDFTLAKPGPDLGPEGYAKLGERFGLTLDASRYADARAAAVESLQRHPELRHDEEVWIAFTERIIHGLGGEGDGARECAREMTRLWEHSANFDLYEDVLPVFEELRRRELKLALISNTARDLDEFVVHHALAVDCAISSRVHGFTKPHPTIFHAVLERLDVGPEHAAMVGDSPEDDVEGARALGIRAFLVDRENRYPDAEGRLTDLRDLPAALG